MVTLTELRRDIARQATAQRAKTNARFFKTGKGEYGEGDQFVGLTMPAARALARQFVALSQTDTTKLLKSKIHEERMIALLILVQRFEHGDATEQKKIFDFYLSHTKWINNWDLVDTSAHKIVGAHLLTRSRTRLTELAGSRDVWRRRIAIVATYAFIQADQYEDTLAISKLLLEDQHDLIHKAVGWMLREVGKRDQKTLESFLTKHCATMPRTMLRYAIERLPQTKRKKYLAGSAKVVG